MRRELRSIFGFLLVAGWFGCGPSTKADFVELERVLAKPAAALAEKLGHRPIIIAERDVSKSVSSWPVQVVIGVEFAAALRRHDRDVVRAGTDPRFQKLDSARVGFNSQDMRFIKGGDWKVLVGLEWTAMPTPTLKIVAFEFEFDQPKQIWSEVVNVPRDAVLRDEIIPAMNREIVKFAQDQMDKKVGNGEGAALAEEALKAAGTDKRQIYRWGRELAVDEPWLPGDILQIENFALSLRNVKREYKHQTVIIEELRSEEIIILQQNAFPRGMVVQREVWPLSSLRHGAIAAFRPWNWPDPNPYPPAFPARLLPAKAVKTGRIVNLLKTLDPKLDRVHGIWYMDKDTLRCHREKCCTIQVPVIPPRSYVLSMTAKRIDGPDELGLGIVVGGYQTMVAIDSFGGTATGLDLLDLKHSNQNETSHAEALLPLGKKVEIQCHVQPEHIKLTVDGKAVLDWRGNSSRLSVDPDFAVPNHDWLFISTHDTTFEISSFTMEPIEDEGL